MGKFLSPTLQQAENAKIKCAVIFYPDDDGAFFLSAVRGQLSHLRFGYMWEGETELTDAISQKFIEADLMTDERFFIEDCEGLLKYLDTGDGDMGNVTVNVDNCCGDGYSVPNITIPIDIDIGNPPSGDGFTDDTTTTYPDDFTDRAEYEAYKCAVATQFHEDVSDFMLHMSGLTNALNWVGDLVQTLLSSAEYWNENFGVFIRRVFAVAKAWNRLVNKLVELSNLGTIGVNWAIPWQTIRPDWEAEKDDIICGLYTSSNANAANIFLRNWIDDKVDTAWGSNPSGHNEVVYRDSILALYDEIIDSNVLQALFEDSGNIGVSGADCSMCQTSGGDYTYTFPADSQGWDLYIGRANWDNVNNGGEIVHHPKDGNSPDPTEMRLTRDDLNVFMGLSANNATALSYVEFELGPGQLADGLANGRTVEFIIYFNNGSNYTVSNINTYGVHTFTGFPALTLRNSSGGQSCIEIKVYSNGNSNNGEVWVDNIGFTHI